MDNDVPMPSSVISGVPPQFDELVATATARNPADRYADAQDMGSELEAIAEELGLPAFRVPAPRDSAQHDAAAAYHSRMLEDRTTAATPERPAPPPILPPKSPPSQPPPPQRPPVLQQTREFNLDLDALPPAPAEQFAGIEMSEFEWARQRARRALVVWVLVILTLTGMVAAGAWTLGSNLQGLI
jgi:serine/threonine protein kinase, bacterial